MLFLFISGACSHYRIPFLPAPDKKPPVGVYHTVQKKETLWRICKTYNVNLQDVAELNNIRDPSQIKIGGKIFIPGVKKTAPVASTPYIEKEKSPPPKIIQHPGLFIWPVEGKVIKEYGIYDNQKHDGINIQAPAGTRVLAAADGKVAFSTFLEGYGNTIIINHSENYATIYANNRNNLVKQGQSVKKGDKIAEVGTSGSSSRSYLHFQIRNNNQPRNPLFYLSQ